MTTVDPALRTISTTCPYCGVGCGVLATPDSHGGVAIAGDPMHPANFGALCSKGAALGETLGLDGRLLHPMLRRDGALARVDWPTALDTVAGGFRRIVDRWQREEPGTNVRVLAQRALDSIYGVDLNPYAVAIARFRLLLAAMRTCGIKRLADAPASA